MAIAVKYTPVSDWVKSTVQSIPLALAGANTATVGETLIVTMAFDNASTNTPDPSISISGTSPPSVTWSNLVVSDSHTASSAGGARSAIVMGVITSGTLTSSHTVVVNTSPTVSAKVAHLMVLTGVDEADPLRVAAVTVQGTGGGTILTPEGGLIGDFGLCAYASEQNYAQSLPNPNFTTGGGSASNMAGAVDYYVLNSNNQRVTFNPGGTSDYSASAIILKQSSGGTSKSASDTLSPKVVETTSFTVTADIAESIKPKIVETIAIAVDAAVSDTLLPKSVDTESVAVSIAKDVADTLAPKIAESIVVDIATSKNGSDTLAVAISESVSITIDASVSDSIKPKVVETSATDVALAVSDSIKPKIADSAVVQLISYQDISDTLAPKVTESLSITVSVVATDTLSPKISDSLSGMPTAISIKFYNGAWTAAANVKFYNGSTWQNITAIKTWNGSQWV